MPVHDVASTTTTDTTTTQGSNAQTVQPTSAAQQAAGRAAVDRIATERGKPVLMAGGGAFLTNEYTTTLAAATGAAATAGVADAVGSPTHLPAHTYVEILDIGSAQHTPQGTFAMVRCQVYTGFGGQIASIPRGLLRAEPRMGHDEGEHADVPQAYGYARHSGILWQGRPSVADVRQGYLGDCYLLAGMGAVVAADPTAIMNLFSPRNVHASSYQVTLYRSNEDGTFIKHVETVDTFLPSDTAGATVPTAGTAGPGERPNSLTYASNGATAADRTAVLWPALVEKAYAQMIGGYDVAGQGGYPNDAMEALTGRPGDSESTPGTDAEVLTKLRGMQGSYAMTAGSLSSRHVDNQAGFLPGTAPNEFNADLQTDQGHPPEIMVNTLKVRYDQTSLNVAAAATATAAAAGAAAATPQATTTPATTEPAAAPAEVLASDDGHGQLTGYGLSGTVAYEQGHVHVVVDTSVVHGTLDPAMLHATYEWQGLLDNAAHVYANHAYIFESVTPDGLIHLRNPWGVEHPNPMTAAQFRALFLTIGSVTLNAQAPAPHPPAPHPVRR